MKVSIALPGYFTQPIGGFHVHYTYANRLAALGHDVSILFPRWLISKASWKGPIGAAIWGARNRIRNRPLTPSFPLRPDVRVRFLPDLCASLPHADILIATAWQTAELIKSASADCGVKFYIVYDYEYWKTADPKTAERIAKTYTTDFNIISTSHAVEQMLIKCGVTPLDRITCGVDLDAFGVDIVPRSRPPLSIGFPLRPEAFKGRADAYRAFGILRQIYGEKLKIRAFGGASVDDVPSWVDCVRRPSKTELRAFYNSTAIFLVPSHFEGFGLPAAEAMACGAALVTTDNGGSTEYAISDQTAIVTPPQDPLAMADAIGRLLENQVLRLRIADAGTAYVQRFDWKKSAAALERALRDSLCW
jgi:glycosyltransferase involved in cell wall biosynthesis